MQPPRVSICIPCFNAERYVAEALESVLAQTYPDLEVIVVDDGSSDGSWAILQDYERHGMRIIRQANAGAPAARNRAFSVSTGDLVFFMDADDLIVPEHISLLADQLKGSTQYVALSEWDRFYVDPGEARFPSRPTNADMDGISWILLDWETCSMTQSGMFLIPRTLMSAYGVWDERLTQIEDFEFFTRILARSKGVRFARGARLYYRSGLSGSVSGRKNRRAVESRFLSISLATGHLLAAEDSPRTCRGCANIFQAFDYAQYPHHPELRAKARQRVAELGGSDLAPDGPPGFHKLRRYIGWRTARRVQLLATRLGLNAVARRRVFE